MAKYKAVTKQGSGGTTITEYSRQEDDFWGTYRKSHRVITKPNGDYETQRYNRSSIFKGWE